MYAFRSTPVINGCGLLCLLSPGSIDGWAVCLWKCTQPCGSVEIMRCDVVLYHPRVLTVASQWETVASHRKQIWLLQVPFNVPWLLFYSSSIIVIVVVMAVGMRIVIIIRLSDSGQRDVQTKSRRVLAQLYSNKIRSARWEHVFHSQTAL